MSDVYVWISPHYPQGDAHQFSVMLLGIVLLLYFFPQDLGINAIGYIKVLDTVVKSWMKEKTSQGEMLHVSAGLCFFAHGPCNLKVTS